MDKSPNDTFFKTVSNVTIDIDDTEFGKGISHYTTSMESLVQGLSDSASGLDKVVKKLSDTVDRISRLTSENFATVMSKDNKGGSAGLGVAGAFSISPSAQKEVERNVVAASQKHLETQTVQHEAAKKTIQQSTQITDTNKAVASLLAPERYPRDAALEKNIQKMSAQLQDNNSQQQMAALRSAMTLGLVQEKLNPDTATRDLMYTSASGNSGVVNTRNQEAMNRLASAAVMKQNETPQQMTKDDFFRKAEEWGLGDLAAGGGLNLGKNLPTMLKAVGSKLVDFSEARKTAAAQSLAQASEGVSGNVSAAAGGAAGGARGKVESGLAGGLAEEVTKKAIGKVVGNVAGKVAEPVAEKVVEPIVGDVAGEVAAGGLAEAGTGALATGAETGALAAGAETAGAGLLATGAGAAGAGLMSVAAPIGIAYALYMASQAMAHGIGSTTQQGMVTGATGPAAYGLGLQQNLAAWSLSQNPMISSDQAKQIVQGSYAMGLKGTQAQGAQNFAAGNLSDMGIDAGTSYDLYKEEILGSGESVDTLTASLKNLQAATSDSNMTVEQMVTTFKTLSTSYLTGQMMPGATASALSMEATKVLGSAGFAGMTDAGKAALGAGLGSFTGVAAQMSHKSPGALMAMGNKLTPFLIGTEKENLLRMFSFLGDINKNNNGKQWTGQDIADYVASLPDNAATAIGGQILQWGTQRGITNADDIYMTIASIINPGEGGALAVATKEQKVQEQDKTLSTAPASDIYSKMKAAGYREYSHRNSLEEGGGVSAGFSKINPSFSDLMTNKYPEIIGTANARQYLEGEAEKGKNITGVTSVQVQVGFNPKTAEFITEWQQAQTVQNDKNAPGS